MHLMDVKRMNLVCCVSNTPMGVDPYLCPSHRLVISSKLPVVQVETLLILAKLHSKVGSTPLQLISYAVFCLKKKNIVIWFCLDGMHRSRFPCACVKIGQNHLRVRISVSPRIDTQAMQRCCPARLWPF